MEIIRGISVAPGVVVGEAVVLDAEEYRIPYREVPAERAEAEVELFRQAAEEACVEVETQRSRLLQRLGRDAADIFDWHVGVLKDPALHDQIIRLIREKHASAAYAVSNVMRGYQRRFQQMQDPLLVERMRDVQDIERRLLRIVLGAAREDLAHLSRPVILVAHDLTPTQTAQLSATKVLGVALEAGAATSHTAILLRSLGRPGVIGLGDVVTRVSGGDTIIIDGGNQLVIVHPGEATLREYREREAAYHRLSDELAELSAVPAETKDGTHVRLLANIEFPHEAAVGVAKGAEGVGLYRTEFLFLRPEGDPSEDEQYEAYCEAIRGAAGHPVTIRTFDLGADKYTQERSYEQERNPMLGLRSIRYSLQHLDMFKTQLRAILRASAHGEVRLMFPLINSLMEFRQAKMAVRDAMEDLEDAGIPFRRELAVGMMLETPAAAMQVSEFCKEVNFISIGTNDLIQYLLAVDRGNEKVSQFYSGSHPSVLRVIRDIVRACTETGIECTLCGEMAGQPLYTMFLVGVGFRSLSMAPGNIGEVKKLIRLATLRHMKRVASRALSFDTDRQVNNYLRDETRKLLPEDPI